MFKNHEKKRARCYVVEASDCLCKNMPVSGSRIKRCLKNVYGIKYRYEFVCLTNSPIFSKLIFQKVENLNSLSVFCGNVTSRHNMNGSLIKDARPRNLRVFDCSSNADVLRTRRIFQMRTCTLVAKNCCSFGKRVCPSHRKDQHG